MRHVRQGSDAAACPAGPTALFPPPPPPHPAQGTINLCLTMAKHGCKNMVFSSSCTVYGNPQARAGWAARGRSGAAGRRCWPAAAAA